MSTNNTETDARATPLSRAVGLVMSRLESGGDGAATSRAWKVDEPALAALGVQQRVIAEWDGYASTVQHIVVLEAEKSGSVLLTYAPNGQLPFAARGVYRWTEDEIVRVNGERITVQDAFDLVDFAGDEGLRLRLVRARVLEQLLAEEGLDSDPVSEHETERAVEAFRRQRGLLSARATEAWLHERGLSPAAFLGMIRQTVRVARLRGRTAARASADQVREAGRMLDAATHVELTAAPETSEEEVRKAVSSVASPWEWFRLAGERGWTARIARTRRGDLRDPVREALLFSRSADSFPHFGTSASGPFALYVLHGPSTEEKRTTHGNVSLEAALLEVVLAERSQRAQVEWFCGAVSTSNE